MSSLILYALKCVCGQRFECAAPHSERYQIKSPCCSFSPCETDFAKLRVQTDKQYDNTELVTEQVSPSEVDEARQLFGDTCEIRRDGSMHVHNTEQYRRFKRRKAEIGRTGTAEYVEDMEKAVAMADRTGQVVVERDD